MKRTIKRIISIVLILAITLGLLPISELTAMAASEGVISMSNRYITVDVSEKNGGFSFKTDNGDKLNKSDDNKDLLYHSDEYDTSFTSFEVTYSDGSVKNYLFGGNYGFLGMSSSKVSVTKINDNEINAVWKLDNLIFTQKLALVSSGANEHGMVNISYNVENNGDSAVSVKARVLLDTALGNQDYGRYQVIDETNTYRSITSETLLTASDSIPQNFYAYDDPYNPNITAYTVSKQGQIPYQAAFGHWNNLASSLFAFSPDATLDFSNAKNKYLTADSAYALYYDMGSVKASGGNSSFLTYYGVYSHQEVANSSTMTVDVTAPTSLSLNSDKNNYIPQVNKGKAHFSVQTEIKNLMGSEKDYSNITLAIYTASGLMPLNAKGEEESGVGYENTEPYTVFYSNVAEGATVSDVLYFAAKPTVNAEYRKIKLQVYDTSSSSAITTDKLLGEKVFYVLCPGTDGNLPEFTFTSLTPDIIYYSGTRHLFLTGTNIDILYTSILNGNCTLKAYNKVNPTKELTVPKGNVLQPGKDKLDIILTDEMATGDWYLQLEWSNDAVKSGIVSAEYQKQTAPALEFIISDDKMYKNDTYGVIAIVQTAGKTSTPAYRIMSFLSEKEFNSFKEGEQKPDGSKEKKYEEILMELRGEFEIQGTTLDAATSSYVPTRIKATSVKASVDSTATNCITINNCIDFEDGVITVFYTSLAGGFGDIQVLFDGALYTSDARTSLWKGEAGFTKIIQGMEYGLIPYDENGDRGAFSANPISLVWPSVFSTAQTIAGMAFNLAYGQLGVMTDDDDNEMGRLISFSAKLDLGFLIPSGTSNEADNTYWTRLQNFWKYYKYGERGEYDDWMYANDGKSFDFSNETKNENTGAASVMVQDILYGCGAGFVGVHFKANIAIPNYIAGMPRVEGTLEVNTIGNWMIALEGGMEMATFTLEAALTLRSYNNIPVPDKIYFFVSGFEPGINIDAHGVIWITGGGGGIDKLYDTIFLTSGVPPLQLMISVSFDLLKVISARADFSVSMRGISFSASQIKIKGTDIVALKKAAVQFDWYPSLYLMGSINMSLFDIINGSGYIVLEGKNYSEWFFEAFVRAGIGIPKSIPIVGGMTIAQVDMGINAEKIWGQLTALYIKLGITYYWGGDFNFGSGELSQPSYPDLLGYEDKPVYYDKETDRTLYMRVGTNLSVAAQPEIADNLAETPRLMGTAPTLYSTGDKLNHKFNLGTRSDSDALITVNYHAASLNEAESIAKTIIANGIKDKNNNLYTLTLYDTTNIDTANANVTYDSEKGIGSLTFTMTHDNCYDKDWSITTPKASDVILYSAAAVPEITSISGSVTGTSLDLNWSGKQMDKLDSVKYYLTSEKENLDSSGYPLGELADSATINSGKITFSIPQNIPGGDYYIRAIYSKDGVVNSAVNSIDSISIVNPKTPAPVSISQVKAAGDLKFSVEIDNPTADAYVVNVYKYDTNSKSWVYSDVSGMVVEKANLVSNSLTIGGSYTFTDDKNSTSTRGLVPNTDYRIGITACNYVDIDKDGNNDTQILSPTETFYSSSGSVTDIMGATSVKLPKPTPPTVTVTADKSPVSISRMVGNRIENFDTYASSDVTFTASADSAMDGTWTLDGDNGKTGTVTGSKALIPLNGLAEGDHTLIVKGVGPNGDGFRNTYSFTIDTLAPRLLLSSPTNGSFFNEDGTLTVTGTTDANALFSIVCDGVSVCTNKSIKELGGSINNDGVFSFKVAIPNANSASSHKVTITASDVLGNMTSEESEVVHGGLSNIQSIDIYADGVNWANNNVVGNALSTKTYQLSLCARTKTGVSFFLTDEKLVSWNCTYTEGKASINADGTLTIGTGSTGFVTGSLRVASTGSLTSSITFGAERAISGYSVVAGSTLGGRVTGGGTYNPDEKVTLTATPDSGYYFTGWTLSGVSVNNTSDASITFNMPAGNVIATANFALKSSPNVPTVSTDNSNNSGYLLTATAGQKVTFKIPAVVNANCFVPYYLTGEKKVYVPMSVNGDGMLIFIAPVAGKYYFEERHISFTDIEGHWAQDNIKSSVARGLFDGIGNGRFDPNGEMTRAMFVTVLWRLAGMPSGGTSTFSDVNKNAYYVDALAWASNNGIVSGYGNGLFGVNDKITREQMCSIFVRYLKYIGYDTSKMSTALSFADEDTISSWAAQSVKLCRSLGIINGNGANLFAPKANATRAESSTMFLNFIKSYINSIK